MQTFTLTAGERTTIYTAGSFSVCQWHSCLGQNITRDLIISAAPQNYRKLVGARDYGHVTNILRTARTWMSIGGILAIMYMRWWILRPCAQGQEFVFSGLLTSGCRGVFLLNEERFKENLQWYFIVHDLTSRFQQWPKFTTHLTLHFIFPKCWETDTTNERHLNWEEVSSERSQHRLMSTAPTKARELPWTAQKTYACATRKHYQRWTIRSVAMGTP